MIKLYYNPEFLITMPKYELWDTLYKGDQQTLKSSKYLWLHELETTQKGANIRKIREERSGYTNHIETLVSQWTSLLFRNDPIIPPSVLEVLGEAIDNIDGKGTSLVSFLRNQLVTNALIFGRPILYVGAYGSKPENLKQQLSTKAFRPYFDVINPLNFVDWEQETSDPQRLGQLNFVRTEFLEARKRESASDEPFIDTVSKQYKMTPEGLEITRYKIKELDNKETALQRNAPKGIEYSDGRSWIIDGDPVLLSDWDEIPIVAELDGQSWLKDIAPHCLKYFNTESVLDNIILFQAHQRVILASDSLNKGDGIVLTEYAISTVPADTTVHTIEPSNSTNIEARLGNILNNIYRLGLNQVRMMSSDSNAVQSDETIKEEKDNVAALVQSEMETLENIANKAIALFAKYLGKEPPEDKIQFTAEVEKEDLDRFIQMKLAFRDETSKMPKLRQAELVKYVTSLSLPNEEEILEEIEQIIFAPTPTQPQIAPNTPLGAFSQAVLEDEEEDEL